MVWKPPRTLGIGVGIVLILTLTGIDLYLIQKISGQPFGLNLVLTVLLMCLMFLFTGLWFYWIYHLFTLRYYLDRNEFVILSGTTRQVIPMQYIRRITRGSDHTAAAHFRGVVWPGYMWGRTELADLGNLSIHSTQPLVCQLIVETDEGCYGISPGHAERFLEDFERRRTLGIMRESQPSETRFGLAALPLWRDKYYWALLALAFGANASLFGWIAERYPSMATRLSVHGSVPGQVGMIIPKSSLLIVPAIGALALVVDGLIGMVLHHRERVGAWLMGLVALGIQGVLWVAALGIVGL